MVGPDSEVNSSVPVTLPLYQTSGSGFATGQYIHVTGRTVSETAEGGMRNVNIKLQPKIKRNQGGSGNKFLKSVQALYCGSHYYEKK